MPNMYLDEDNIGMAIFRACGLGTAVCQLFPVPWPAWDYNYPLGTCIFGIGQQSLKLLKSMPLGSRYIQNQRLTSLYFARIQASFEFLSFSYV